MLRQLYSKYNSIENKRKTKNSQRKFFVCLIQNCIRYKASKENYSSRTGWYGENNFLQDNAVDDVILD